MSFRIEPGPGPHGEASVYRMGAPVEEARAALLLIHGRGGSAQEMLEMARATLERPGLAMLAPQAVGFTWYPYSFLAPVADNEPGLSSGLNLIERVLRRVEDEGVPSDRVVLLGFSQGACLAAEYAARNARRYGGLVALSGGLIGPEGTPRHYEGSFDGTPVFIGCSDVDPHIPLRRVKETSEVLRALGAKVTERIYPGMGHTVNDDELAAVRELLEAVRGGDGEAAEGESGGA